jgi:GT2 family glycosyltransferase
MDLSIIFVNYQSETYLYNCIQSIYQHCQKRTFEIIVIDNFPIPGANQAILSSFPDTKWLNQPSNSGFSIANNRGLAAATGNFVLFLNADTLAFDHSIEKGIEYLEKQPGIAAIGAYQVHEDLSRHPFYWSQNQLRKDLYILPGHPQIQKLLFSLLPNEIFQSAEETNNLVGFFMLMKKETALRAGGWDEDFFLYAEDVEFSNRLAQIGKLCYFEDVQMIHLVGKNPFRRTKISFVNRFSVQIQISNLLWIRKSYGPIAYLIIMLNYALVLPGYWFWKCLNNLSKGKSILFNTENQILFTRKLIVLFSYLPKILFLKPYLFQIKPEENIDLLEK